MVQRFRQILSFLSVAVCLYVVVGFVSQAHAKQEIDWESLDLSTQQRNTLNNLDQHWKDSVQEVAPRIQGNEKKLKQLINSPKPPEDEIMGVQQQIHEDKSRLKMEATQIFLRKRKALTRDQEEKLMKMINLH